MSLDGEPPSVVISGPRVLISDVPGLLWARDGRIIFDSFAESLSPGLQSLGNHDRPTNRQTLRKRNENNELGRGDGSLGDYEPGCDSSCCPEDTFRSDVYVGELKDGGTRLDSPTRLTVSESIDYSSGWMHDSKTILFSSNRPGRNQIFRQQLNQDTAEPLILGPDDETSRR